MVGVLRKFWNDERGLALILFAIMLPAIVGFSALTIDMSRVNNLHNDMQKATDALALAGAAELDGQPTAWTRSQNALTNLLSNDTTFSDAGIVTLPGTGAITIDSTYSACRSMGQISWCFLSSLPANDSDMITSANYATSASVTRFIMVEAKPETFSTLFPASFLSGNTTDDRIRFGAVSVAGFTRGVCDFTPVYICNPYEGAADSIYDVVADPTKRRRLIELRQQGGNTAQNSPGNYGFLQPPPNVTGGANAIRDMIAQIRSQACYNSQGVSLRPGFIASVRDALNVRLDVYNGSMNGNRTDPNFAPGNNVRKGYKLPNNGNACNANSVSPAQPTQYEAFPRDNCFANSSCSIASGRVGDGNWDFNQYWATNFATTTNPVTTAKPLGADGISPASNTNQPTRYSVYRYEIAQGIVNHASNGGERGTPACAPTSVSNPDRRILYGAILNCQALAAAGLMSGGNSSPPLPVEAFASFFITETVESGNDQTIRVELVDVTGREGQGTLDNFIRDEAQLYR